MDPRAKRIFIGVHIGLLGLLLLFPLYSLLTGLLPEWIPSCFLHDVLFLYCPFCGGTRAVESLFHLQFAEALRCNPFVPLLAVGFLAMDIRALLRLRRGERELYRTPNWVWIALTVLFVLYGVYRNVMMIRCGHDPLGDLGWFWNR